MPTAKRKGNKQPEDDPALAKAVDRAADKAAKEAKTGDVVNTPQDTLHLHDIRPE